MGRSLLLMTFVLALCLPLEARAQTAEQFLADKQLAGMAMCLVPRRGVLYCETFIGEKGLYLVIYNEDAEPLVINQLFPDGSQVVVWSEGEPV